MKLIKSKTPIDNEKKIPIKERIREIVKRPKTKFLSKNQEIYWNTLNDNQITLCFGPSGTGKSFIALKKAIDLICDEDNKYEKIVIVRPAIESADQGHSIGMLPGNLDEKMDPYIQPSFHILNKIIGKDATKKLKDNKVIEMLSLNYIRGWSIDNSILILEESQNTTPSEMKLILTRIGFNSKFFISGDIEQSDRFKDKSLSGLFDAKKRLDGLNSVGVFEFDSSDIVRNPIIGEILNRYSDV
jgi:phosphate starvation-inducible PhoH-like protein